MQYPMPRGYHEFYAVFEWVRINRISLVQSVLLTFVMTVRHQDKDKIVSKHKSPTFVHKQPPLIHYLVCFFLASVYC